MTTTLFTKPTSMSTVTRPSTCHCERCGQFTLQRRVSWFNTDMICDDCMGLEMVHPQYDEARAKEKEAMRNKEYAFPGIGLPEDLRPVNTAVNTS